jgi:succinate-semialdehyde dehydrogenase/glutarate-semialdehyde dehydrogenase
MITRKAGPALATGCTVVLKPSDLTPLTSVALSVLSERAGIPGGMFKLVTADRTLTVEVGEEMCSSCTVRKILFTGSTPVSKLLMKLSGDTVKQLSLELGGNATFIGEPPNAINLHMVNLKRKSNRGM